MSMTHDEMIAVIAAHKEGRAIQFRSVDRPRKPWEDYGSEGGSPSWNFFHFDFRIKPEPRKPREIWVNEYPDGHSATIKSGFGHYFYLTAEEATQGACGGCIATRKFIEVIEDEESA